MPDRCLKDRVHLTSKSGLTGFLPRMPQPSIRRAMQPLSRHEAQPGVITIIVRESKAEFVVARQGNLYEKPLTEWPAQCYDRKSVSL